MLPETHLSQCLSGKLRSSADLTPSVSIPPCCTGGGIGLQSQEFNLEAQIHLQLTVVKMHCPCVTWKFK